MSEIVTPELAVYYRQMREWHSEHEVIKKFGWLSFSGALPMWVVSLFASGAGGATSNTLAWWTAFTVVTFIGATLLTFMGICAMIVKVLHSQPVKPSEALNARD